MLGIGRNAYDPYNKFSFDGVGMELTNQQLENLFTYNGIANKIITAPVDDAIRAGLRLLTAKTNSFKTTNFNQ